jgi:polyhydroxybutyrate depolymerase
MAATLAVGLGGMALPAAATDIPPPEGDWGPGNYPSALHSLDFISITGVSGQKDYTREYKVHVPKGYDKNHPAPVVFCLPGIGETVVMFCVRGTNTTPYKGNGLHGGLIDKSDENGFVLIMPEGYDVSWNAGVCCGKASTEQLDDVALMRAILDEVKKHVNVDTKRVYAVGFSNGAFLADRLACEASDMIAAVVEASGGIRTLPKSACRPQYPVAVLGTHGQGGNDYFVRYSNDLASMEQFARANGCSTQTAQASFPSSVGDGTQPGDVTCVSYMGCPSNTEVTFCSVQQGGHCWYGTPSCGTGFGAAAAKIALGKGIDTQNISDTDIIWPFLSKYHR